MSKAGPVANAKKRQSDMRWEQYNAFVDETMRSLTPAEFGVWFILFRDARPPSWEARASFDDIARRAGINRRTVTRAVGSLEARGLLKVEKRGGLNRGCSSYIVLPFKVD